MNREEAIERFDGIINAMSISIAQSKFYPSKAELNELCDMAIEALSADVVPFEVQLQSTREAIDRFAEDRVKVVRCKDCKWAEKAILDEYCVECTMYHTSCMKHGYCHHGERREP